VELEARKYYDGPPPEKGGTSIRGKRGQPSPAIKWLFKRQIKPGMLVLDFGAGRYARNADWLRKKGVEVYAYDPYNATGADGWSQRKVSNRLPKKGTQFDVVLTSYVLNVVPKRIEDNIVKITRRYAPVVIHVTRNDLENTVSDALTRKDSVVLPFFEAEYLPTNKAAKKAFESNGSISKATIKDFCEFGVKTSKGFQRLADPTKQGMTLRSAPQFNVYIDRKGHGAKRSKERQAMASTDEQPLLIAYWADPQYMPDEAEVQRLLPTVYKYIPDGHPLYMGNYGNIFVGDGVRVRWNPGSGGYGHQSELLIEEVPKPGRKGRKIGADPEYWNRSLPSKPGRRGVYVNEVIRDANLDSSMNYDAALKAIKAALSNRVDESTLPEYTREQTKQMGWPETVSPTDIMPIYYRDLDAAGKDFDVKVTWEGFTANPRSVDPTAPYANLKSVGKPGAQKLWRMLADDPALLTNELWMNFDRWLKTNKIKYDGKVQERRGFEVDTSTQAMAGVVAMLNKDKVYVDDAFLARVPIIIPGATTKGSKNTWGYAIVFPNDDKLLLSMQNTHWPGIQGDNSFDVEAGELRDRLMSAFTSTGGTFATLEKEYPKSGDLVIIENKSERGEYNIHRVETYERYPDGGAKFEGSVSLARSYRSTFGGREFMIYGDGADAETKTKNAPDFTYKNIQLKGVELLQKYYPEVMKSKPAVFWMTKDYAGFDMVMNFYRLRYASEKKKVTKPQVAVPQPTAQDKPLEVPHESEIRKPVVGDIVIVDEGGGTQGLISVGKVNNVYDDDENPFTVDSLAEVESSRGNRMFSKTGDDTPVEAVDFTISNARANGAALIQKYLPGALKGNPRIWYVWVAGTKFAYERLRLPTPKKLVPDFAAEKLRRIKEGLGIQLSYQQRHLAKELGGIWYKKKKMWLLPDRESLEAVAAKVGVTLPKPKTASSDECQQRCCLCDEPSDTVIVHGVEDMVLEATVMVDDVDTIVCERCQDDMYEIKREAKRDKAKPHKKKRKPMIKRKKYRRKDVYKEALKRKMKGIRVRNPVTQNRVGLWNFRMPLPARTRREMRAGPHGVSKLTFYDKMHSYFSEVEARFRTDWRMNHPLPGYKAITTRRKS